MRLPDFLLVGKPLDPNHLVGFIAQYEMKSLDKLRVLSWLSFVLYVFLLYLDVRRKSSGVFYSHALYGFLEVIHFSGILFLIPAVILALWKKEIAENVLMRKGIIYASFAIFVLALYTNGVIAFYESGNVILYTAFMLVTNWAFPMNHLQRLIFNVISAGVIIFLVLEPVQSLVLHNPEDPDLFKLVTIYEVVGMTLVAHILGAFDFNLRLDKYLDEQQLQKEQQHVVELERAKSHLYTNLTHEFRTPLTVISGMTEQIQLNPGKWTDRGIEMIQRNSARMLNLVNQILDLNKLESGHMSVNRVYGDIVPYLKYGTVVLESPKTSWIIFLTDFTKPKSIHRKHEKVVESDWPWSRN